MHILKFCLANQVFSHPDFSGIRLIEALHQFHDRRFSGTVVAYYCSHLSARYPYWKIMKNFRSILIPEIHIFKHNILILRFDPGFSFLRIFLIQIKNFTDMSKRTFRSHHILPHRQEFCQIHVYLCHICTEHIDSRRLHFPCTNQARTSHRHYDCRKQGINRMCKSLNLWHESVIHIRPISGINCRKSTFQLFFFHYLSLNIFSRRQMFWEKCCHLIKRSIPLFHDCIL